MQFGVRKYFLKEDLVACAPAQARVEWADDQSQGTVQFDFVPGLGRKDWSYGFAMLLDGIWTHISGTFETIVQAVAREDIRPQYVGKVEVLGVRTENPSDALEPTGIILPAQSRKERSVANGEEVSVQWNASEWRWTILK